MWQPCSPAHDGPCPHCAHQRAAAAPRLASHPRPTAFLTPSHHGPFHRDNVRARTHHEPDNDHASPSTPLLPHQCRSPSCISYSLRSMQSVLRAARAADDRVLVNVVWRKPRAVDSRRCSSRWPQTALATCSPASSVRYRTRLARRASRSWIWPATLRAASRGWIEVRRSPAARTRSPPVRCLRAGRPRPGTNGRRVPARASTCPCPGPVR